MRGPSCQLEIACSDPAGKNCGGTDFKVIFNFWTTSAVESQKAVED